MATSTPRPNRSNGGRRKHPSWNHSGRTANICPSRRPASFAAKTANPEGATKVPCTQNVAPSAPSSNPVAPSSAESSEGVTRTPQGVEGVEGVSAREQVTSSKVSPEGVTKVSCTQNVTPSTPSGETVTPSSTDTGTYEESSVSAIHPGQTSIDPVRSDAGTYEDLWGETGTYEPLVCSHRDCEHPAESPEGLCEDHVRLKRQMDKRVRNRRLCARADCPREPYDKFSYCALHVMEGKHRDKFETEALV